jgi:diguanylate cyclase (GGDEF)-like protein/PAS domain S-box-containing protein
LQVDGHTRRRALRIWLRITATALFGSLVALIIATVRAASDTDERLAIWTALALAGCIVLATLEILMLSAARNRDEAALQRSEERHRAIVEEQTELVSLASADGTLVYVNPAYARHYGDRADALVGRTLYEFVSPADVEMVRERLASVLATGQPLQGENRVTAAGVGERWIAWTNTLQRTPSGEVLLHSVGRDVTRSKAAEQALRASEDFLARTGRVAGVGGWEIDLRTHEVHWSDQVKRIHEVPADFAPTLERALSFYSDEARQAVTQAMADAQQRGIGWNLELAMITARGRELTVRAVGEAEFDAAGNPRRLVGAVQDITDRKRLEQRLASQTATLNSVVEAIPAMIAVWDSALRYRLVNTAFERWRGKAREQIVGRTIEEVIGTAEYESVLPWIGRALIGETVTFEGEHPQSAASKHTTITLVPLRYEEGGVGGVVGIAQDITRHREEQLRLVSLTERDPLTGLLNRVGFENFLQRSVDAGEGPQLAMLFIDLDHFKPVNDAHGHATGDAILRDFADRLRALVRPTDAVARIGGDEFGVGLAGVRDQGHAEAVADKVVAAASRPFRVGQLDLAIGASVGVAFRVNEGDNGDGWQGLIARADAMVYRAKAAGRARRA